MRHISTLLLLVLNPDFNYFMTLYVVVVRSDTPCPMTSSLGMRPKKLSVMKVSFPLYL